MLIHAFYIHKIHVSEEKNPDKANCANRVKLFWIHVNLSSLLHRRGSAEDPRKTSAEDVGREPHREENQ